MRDNIMYPWKRNWELSADRKTTLLLMALFMPIQKNASSWLNRLELIAWHRLLVQSMALTTANRILGLLKWKKFHSNATFRLYCTVVQAFQLKIFNVPLLVVHRKSTTTQKARALEHKPYAKL